MPTQSRVHVISGQVRKWELVQLNSDFSTDRPLLPGFDSPFIPRSMQVNAQLLSSPPQQAQPAKYEPGEHRSL
jgi:hypothetical protein